MRHAAAFILAFASLSAQIVGAQSVAPTGASTDSSLYAQKAKVIRKIMEAAHIGDLQKQVTDFKLHQIMMARRQNQLFPSAFLDELEVKSRERVNAIDLVEFVIPTYSKNFSLDELQQILAFYQSPVGQKIARLQPALYSDMAAGAFARGQQIGRDVTREILAEHPEYIAQIRENRAKMQGQPDLPSSASQGPVYQIANGVTPPHVIEKKDPEYTPQAVDAKISGSVLLSIVVDTAGAPRNIRVLRPLGLGLDEKAVEAVRQWRFKPGEKDGHPVRTETHVEVNFRLLQKSASTN